MISSESPLTANLPREAATPGRVLVVGNFLSGHGLTRGVCEDLADRLEAAGWEVSRTSTKTSRLGRIADMLRTAWSRREHYDVAQIDVFSGPAFVWAEAVCALLRRLGKPFVLTLHGGNLPAFAARHPGRVRRLLAGARTVTAPSRYLLEGLAPYREGLILLPNALDLSAYEFRERAAPAPRLVWVRAFCEIYNPSMAAHVVAGLRTEFPDIRLTMVGPDKGDNSLAGTRTVAAQLGVQDCITYTGGVPKAQIPAYLKDADIFINTTNIDNTPVSVMEAMAAGLVVVTTDAGGLPYLVRHESDALTTPVGDAATMTEAVRRVLREPELATRLSAGARETADAFDWERVLPVWQELLAVPEAGPRTSARKGVGPQAG